MTVEAAQSVRIAIGANQSHQSLAAQLSHMGLDVDVVTSAQGLYDVEPSVVVLDPELLGDLSLHQLREKLPLTVFIAADAILRGDYDAARAIYEDAVSVGLVGLEMPFFSKLLGLSYEASTKH